MTPLWTRTIILFVVLFTLLLTACGGSDTSDAIEVAVQQTLVARGVGTDVPSNEVLSPTLRPTREEATPFIKEATPASEQGLELPSVVTPTREMNEPAETDELYRLVAYNYTLTDVGNGWNEGSVEVAIENLTDSVLYLESFDFRQGGATLETLEGPTYKVNIMRKQGRAGLDGWRSINVAGPIPPRYRIKAVGGNPGTIKNDTVLTWKSAMAATPTRIVFPDYPGLVLELPSEQGTLLSFEPSESFPHITEAGDLRLIDNPEGLQVTLYGTCSLRGSSFSLGVFYQNNDGFQEVNIQDDLQAMSLSVFDKVTGYQNYQTFTPSYDRLDESLYRLGPGQSTEGQIVAGGWEGFKAGANSLIVFWLQDGSYQIFDLLGCGAHSLPSTNATGQIAYIGGSEEIVDFRSTFRNQLIYVIKSSDSPPIPLAYVGTLLENLRDRPAWTPGANGNSLALHVDGKLVQLTRTDNDKHLAEELYIGEAYQPDYSPNGEYLVFASFEQLYLLSLDSRIAEPLTEPDGQLFQGYPAWSPDGRQIAFVKGEVARNTDIYLVDVETRSVQRLTNTENNNYLAPSWSPDGSQLVFTCQQPAGTDVELCVVGADGSNLRQITPAEEFSHELDPDWGPDGILFVGLRPGGRDVYLIDPVTGKEQRITVDGDDVGEQWPMWIR